MSDCVEGVATAAAATADKMEVTKEEEEATLTGGQGQNLDSILGVCSTMMALVQQLEALDKRIYHLKTDLVALSQESTDMTSFRRRKNHPNSILHGVQSAKKPFEKFSKLDQFDLLNKILTMRLEMSVKFEALRKAQMAVQRAKVIKKTFRIDLESGENKDAATAAADPEEAEYMGKLLKEQADLSGQIMKIEEQRISKALDVLAGKVKIMELFGKFKREFDLYMDEVEDDDEEDMEEEEENQTGNGSQEGAAAAAAAAAAGAKSSPEVRKLDGKKKQLAKAENRLIQMKTIVQKLMFNSPDVIAGVGLDQQTAKEFQDMMFFCGKSVEEMRK